MQYSIVNYSGLEKTSLRLDPEYYHPENLRLYFHLIGNTHEQIGDFCYVTDGIHASIDFDENSGINLISAKAPKDNSFDLSGTGFISVIQDKQNPRTHLKKNDVILSTVGTIGNCAVVDETILPANADRHVGIIRIKDDHKPRFLSAFLLSKYGRFQTLREATGNVQLNLFIYKIKEIVVPKLTTEFQEHVESICLKADTLGTKAVELYKYAEQTLLSELNLLNWKPRHRLSFIKNFSDTQSADRIDAEYFQPMYEEVVKAVKSSKKYACLGDIVSIKKCIEPGSESYRDSGIPFLRVSNLSKFWINNDNQQYLSDSLYDTLKTHQPKEGEILLSKDATPGIAYYLKDVPGKMIPSGGILRLTVKDTDTIHPEYLTLVLNCAIVQKQIERDAGGSVINHWLVDQVKNTLIPILPTSVQKEISEKVDMSFSNRLQSKRLLDIAKRSVEIAIEKNEKEAESWINNEMIKLGIKDA